MKMKKTVTIAGKEYGTAWLAPMAGMGDASFRRICKEHGADYMTTEMVSAKALCYGDKKTPFLAAIKGYEAPIAIQLFGSEPDAMARASEILLELSAKSGMMPAAIDVNMGCPMTKVVKNGDGSALIVPGIHNEEIAIRRRFLYIEETNEITGGVVAPAWMMEKVSNNDYSDAVVETEYTSELMALVKELENGKLLYGPAVIPEYDSNIYGFLAENGENLEDVWYGLWNRDLGTLTKIPLFSETVKP